MNDIVKSVIYQMRTNRIVAITGAVVASEILWLLYKNIRSVIRRVDGERKIKAAAEINEVMFFSDEGRLCRGHDIDAACSSRTCSAVHLRKLLDYINNARLEILVCMYYITCRPLTQALLAAHDRGVVVKLVTEERTALNSDSDVDELFRRGVQVGYVKPKDAQVLMHHKFVVVDGTILFTGSLNWTMSALFGNYENLLITNSPPLVKPYHGEFQRVWRDLQSRSREVP